jgi:transposase
MLNSGHSLSIPPGGAIASGVLAFSALLSDCRVPVSHPLRRIKLLSDEALGAISSELDGLPSSADRVWIAPERLLKGQLLMALYSIPSDRKFCHQLGSNLLFRWFLDMDMERSGLDPWSFRQLRKRAIEASLACRFFDEVFRRAIGQRLLSSGEFTVNHALVRALCSSTRIAREDCCTSSV